MLPTPPLLPRPTVKLGLKLAAAFALATAFVALFRRQIFVILLPIFLWEVSWLGDDFRIIGIGVRRVAADTYIGLDAAVSRPIAGAGKMLFPNSGFEMAALVLSGYILQTIAIFIGVLLAWPVNGWRAGAARCGLGLLSLLGVLMIDVPLVLLASLWEGVLNELGDKRFIPLHAWENFLTYGGRLGLTVFASIATVLLAEWLTRARPGK